MSPAAGSEPIAIGVIGRARGLRGECHVTPLGGTLEGLQCPARVQVGREAEQPRPLTLRSVAWASRGLVCSFEGVADRDAAEGLRHHTIYVDRSELPAPGEGRYYEFELVGLEVRDGERVVGVVKQVHSYPTMGALEVQWHDGRTVQVPMTADVVKRVAVDEGWIAIDGAALSGLV
jgi:16S rRNA processing protein RimM